MLGSKLRAAFVIGALCVLAPFAMAETPRYLDYCCSEITPPPANYGRGGARGVIVDPDSPDPACFKSISAALKSVHSNGTIWVKPSNRKTLIESLTIRKPVKIRRYAESDLSQVPGTRRCNVVQGLGPDEIAILNERIREQERLLRDIRDDKQKEAIEAGIDRLKSQITDINEGRYYRIQPVSGEFCARVSLKNRGGRAQISDAKFLPPPDGENRTKDCIVLEAGNLSLSDININGTTGRGLFGRRAAGYRGIVLQDGSADIRDSEIRNTRIAIDVVHQPKPHPQGTPGSPREREIVIDHNLIQSSRLNGIRIAAPVRAVITNNDVAYTRGAPPTGPNAFAGVVSYAKGPICGNIISGNPIGIVHYGSGELRDNTIFENDTGVSLRIDNQSLEEKFRLYNNIIAGSKKVGLSAPRGSIQEHNPATIARLYAEGREEEIYKNDRGDSSYFNGNQFCNRTNVFRMRDLPPGARRANSFKGGRAYIRRCNIERPPYKNCSASYTWNAALGRYESFGP